MTDKSEAALGPEQVEILGRLAGIAIHPDHLPGVVRNLGVVLGQAALLFDPPLDPLIEPATVFRP
jgi:hypothetical protein